MSNDNRNVSLVKYKFAHSAKFEIPASVANIPVFVPYRENGVTLTDFVNVGTFAEIFGRLVEPPPVRIVSTTRDSARWSILRTNLTLARRRGVFNVRLVKYPSNMLVLPSGGLRNCDPAVVDAAVDASWGAWQRYAPMLASRLLDDPDSEPDRAWQRLRDRTPVYHLPTTATSRERTAYKKSLIVEVEE